MTDKIQSPNKTARELPIQHQQALLGLLLLLLTLLCAPWFSSVWQQFNEPTLSYPSNPTEIIKESPENFNYAYSLNVSGPMYLSKLFAVNLSKSKNPTIIFVSSLGGKVAYVGGGNYTNAKRAIGGLVDTMRLEYPTYGIKVTEICPGSIDTVDGEQRDIALTAEDMACAIFWVAELPKHVNVNYLEMNHISIRR